ncbi:aldehyde dehydrogenase family protein [Cecembia calidifontis]|jgi:acyl-CoA reductase-like NAD-dependent aldehyde dehydrogenase|uniref:Acyl-CoA reductase-like NAD-dependent aldehyde dehydrogenase n=1 Tax=Cecembia calidifontis TaxID=1187080 RepID=A0A4Q7PCH6_9BACT|nr:aldehyde dehydrogenase family protein [Cecembia calidifontis]RZS97290.1 acyl-CoA reductase-like NAD-dependent aldehyde dehydrogenase [Cecembia calidifontis]
MSKHKTLKVFSPYDNRLIKEIPMVGENEVENALEKAYALFDDRSNWIPAFKRIEILEKVQELMKSKIEELTKTAAEEGGKPYVDSKVEVLRAINGVKIASEEIGRLTGKQIPMGLTQASVNRVAFTTREPIGVVASISAFNHPLNLIVHQTVTAFAAGCPVIVKPASTTPLSCLAFADILKEAGVPDPWVQVLITDNEAAEKLVTDQRINYLSFIGSAKVGWYLKSKLAPGTRCALEHGGAAPVIVEPDANLEDMLPALVKGGFYHAGQVCVSVQKVFVHESIAKKVADDMAKMAEKLIVGDPLDEKTEVGPLILPKEVDRVEAWVKEAKETGGEILCGGKRLSDSCYAPTVIYNPPQDAKVSQEEIFGPVVCVYSYEDRNKAIEQANALPYHFQAAVFTKDLDIALDTVQKLNATAVMINDHTAFRVDWMPFGGRDASGEGLGGIPYSMHEMTREKMMVIKSKFL